MTGSDVGGKHLEVGHSVGYYEGVGSRSIGSLTLHLLRRQVIRYHLVATDAFHCTRFTLKYNELINFAYVSFVWFEKNMTTSKNMQEM